MTLLIERDLVTGKRYIEHDRADGVLCWGGPEHGKVWAIPPTASSTVYTFTLHRNPGLGNPEGDPSRFLSVATVSYDFDKVAARYGDTREVWTVLLYGGTKMRLTLNLIAHMNLILWMASQ